MELASLANLSTRGLPDVYGIRLARMAVAVAVVLSAAVVDVLIFGLVVAVVVVVAAAVSYYLRYHLIPSRLLNRSYDLASFHRDYVIRFYVDNKI